jgi:hypothetical protein
MGWARTELQKPETPPYDRPDNGREARTDEPIKLFWQPH